MKAKEMAAAYNAAPTEVEKLAVLQDLVFNEIKGTEKLAKARGAKTNSALAAILREADDRWRAFARLCDGVKPDGFKDCLHAAVPQSKLLLP